MPFAEPARTRIDASREPVDFDDFDAPSHGAYLDVEDNFVPLSRADARQQHAEFNDFGLGAARWLQIRELWAEEENVAALAELPHAVPRYPGSARLTEGYFEEFSDTWSDTDEDEEPPTVDEGEEQLAADEQEDRPIVEEPPAREIITILDSDDEAELADITVARTEGDTTVTVIPDPDQEN
jgi:hypothetical protein